MPRKSKKSDDKWIADAVKKPGALHRQLGIAEDKNIPSDKLKIKPSDSTLMKRRKNLARTLTRMNRKRKTK